VDNPLTSNPKSVVTPHLGASTSEAQVAVAVDVVRDILGIFRDEPARHPVNAPMIPPEVQMQLQPFGELAERLGCAASQLVDHGLGTVEVTYAGQLADLNTDPLRALLIKGLLERVTDTQVTMVNANLLARDRGLEVVEKKTSEAEHFANLITVSFRDDGHQRQLCGTLIGGRPYIVRIDQFRIEFILEGYQMLILHRDRPGLIGQVGELTGLADINIAFMGVGRLEPRGEAMMVLSLDECVTDDVRKQIASIPDVYDLHFLEL
jgi:D-3-phosphoglycerate dehydrogenase